MTRRRTISALALVALLTGFVPSFLGLAPKLLVGETAVAWLPRFATPGQTVVTYLLAARVLGFLFVPVAAALVGHRVHGTVAIADEPRLVLQLFLLVGVVFVTVGGGLAVLAFVLELGFYPRALTAPVDVLVRGFERGVLYGVSAFAGAALAQLGD